MQDQDIQCENIKKKRYLRDLMRQPFLKALIVAR